VRVGEETLGVGDNLADMEAVGLVLTGGHVGDVDEEGALQATVRGAALIRTGWVGEGLKDFVSDGLWSGVGSSRRNQG
jgi:hypothetical protein